MSPQSARHKQDLLQYELFNNPEHAAGYQICTRCIMDTTDPEITFDDKGICSHCKFFDEKSKELLFEGPEGRKQLSQIANQIKEEGQGKEYNCVIGLSGGVDSSYVAYVVKEIMGLEPLAVHFDCGWNSETAVSNIENIVKKLDIDLYTWVCDWEEMRDLQRSFIKASVANADIPTDHAFVAATYAVANQHKLRYIISGSNFATECILPKAWGYSSKDLRHIRSIQKRFGSLKLKHYPQIGFLKEFLYYRKLKNIKTIRVLNYLPYVKAEAMQVLQDKLGWKYYGGKHYESVFTRFFQAYYLPRKFGYDKRKAHLSSLIVSGQMTRETALAEMEKDVYPEDQLLQDRDFVLKKLGLSQEEFEEIMTAPLKTHRDYPNYAHAFHLKTKLGRVLRTLRLLD